jgi:hypothetical protein
VETVAVHMVAAQRKQQQEAAAIAGGGQGAVKARQERRKRREKASAAAEQLLQTPAQTRRRVGAWTGRSVLEPCPEPEASPITAAQRAIADGQLLADEAAEYHSVLIRLEQRARDLRERLAASEMAVAQLERALALMPSYSSVAGAALLGVLVGAAVAAVGVALSTSNRRHLKPLTT